MKISLCIVACNDAAQLARCIEDARPHVDEVVVAVQPSDDGTLQVARKFADIVVESEAFGYCEASRALAHNASKGDWVLVLDCDEAMSEKFKGEMRRLAGERGATGYRLMRQLWIDDTMVFQGDTQYRFFDRRHVRYLPEIHTEPQPTSPSVNMDYVGIVHRKTLAEQLKDEERCERVLTDPKANYGNTSPVERAKKLALNWHRERGEK